MSNDQNGGKGKNQQVDDLRAEIDRLSAEAEAKREKFSLKDTLTRLLLEEMPRHSLYNCRWKISERFEAKDIPAILDYMKAVLPAEAALIDAYRPEILSYREQIDRKNELDAENLAIKATQPPPVKAPELDMKPVRIGA